MEDKGLTDKRGMNVQRTAGPDLKGPPKNTSGGVSLKKGYEVISPQGESPHAVSPDDGK